MEVMDVLADGMSFSEVSDSSETRDDTQSWWVNIHNVEERCLNSWCTATFHFGKSDPSVTIHWIYRLTQKKITILRTATCWFLRWDVLDERNTFLCRCKVAWVTQVLLDDSFESTRLDDWMRLENSHWSKCHQSSMSNMFLSNQSSQSSLQEYTSDSNLIETIKIQTTIILQYLNTNVNPS
jgi:hypothetical protein